MMTGWVLEKDTFSGLLAERPENEEWEVTAPVAVSAVEGEEEGGREEPGGGGEVE